MATLSTAGKKTERCPSPDAYQKTIAGTWYITYWQDGKQKHRSLGTRNERKARRLLREVELSLQDKGTAEVIITDRPRTAVKNPGVDEFWEGFVRWAVVNRSRSSVEEFTVWFMQFKDFTRIKRMGDASPSDVVSFKAKLLLQGEKKPKGIGLGKASINNAIKTLRSIWNHARKLGLYSGDNPFNEVEPFRLPQRNEKGYLDGEQIAALLRAAKQHGQEKYVKEMEARNVRFAIALTRISHRPLIADTVGSIL